MREFLNITKALADENRLRMLMALQAGELCVCQITELMGLAMSTVSKHLSVLYQAGLVNARKEGRWTYYSLPGKGTPTAAREAVSWVRRSLDGNQRIAEDATQLKRVVAMDLTELCKRQCKNCKCCSCAPVIRAGARWPKAGHARSKARRLNRIRRASRNTA